MAFRSYAQINCSLTGSKKFRQLNTAGSKLAYIVAHLSDQANYLGYFKYPKVVWAYDCDLSISILDIVIRDLVTVGLVEYDHEEELIRIVGWYKKKNAPENASRAIGVMKDYRNPDFPLSDMGCRSIAEFVVYAMKLSLGWGPDQEKFREHVRPFLAQMAKDHGELLLDSILDEIFPKNESLFSELDSLLPNLSYRHEERVPTPCRDTTLDETTPDQENTKTKTNTETNIKTAISE